MASASASATIPAGSKPGIFGMPLRQVLTFTVPAVAASSLTSNPGLTIAAVVSLALIALMLWRPGESAILFFVCVMQWLQGALKVLQADVLGVGVWTLSSAQHMEKAILLTLLWIVTIAIGARLALISPRGVGQRPSAFDSLTVPQLARIYIAWTLLLQVVGIFAYGGTRQLLMGVADMRWAVVFAIFWRVIAERKRYWLLVGVALFELGAGFLSYFSSFRTPLFLLVLALPAGNYRLRLKHLALGTVFGAFVLYLGSVWSAIKMDYRDVMSRGAMDQVVQIDTGTQASALLDLVANLDTEALEIGFGALLDRVAYVEYFAFTMDFVPSKHAHEDGLLWGRVPGHVLTPRLFFPEKDDLEDDTEVAQRYTGIDMKAGGKTTSIALGTAAETYIDYGSEFMFVPAFLLGVLWGLICRRFMPYSMHSGLAQGFMVALLVPISTLELSPAKLIGGTLTRLFIATLLWTFALPLLLRLTLGPAKNPTSALRARSSV